MLSQRSPQPRHLIAALVVALFALSAWFCPRIAQAKPPIPDVPGQVVRMDLSPLALERRALREAMVAEQVALAELRAQLAAATDDDTRGDLAVAIEARKNGTRVRLLEVRIEHARARGEHGAMAKLESRRAKLVRQVGERLPSGPATETEVAR